MKMLGVYHPEDASEAVAALQKAGISATVAGQATNTDPTLIHYPGLNYKVQVFVPDEQHERAVALLRELDAARQPQVEALGREFVSQLAWVVAGPAVILLAAWLLELPEGWFLVTLLGGTAAWWAWLRLRYWRRGQQAPPTAEPPPPDAFDQVRDPRRHKSKPRR